MKTKIREWIFTLSAFVTALYLYAFFSYIGYKDFIKDGILKDYFNTNVWHLEVIFSGVSFGALFLLINQLTEQQAIRRKSFGFNILLKSTLYLLALLIVSVLIFISFSFFGLVPEELLDQFQSFLSPVFLLSIATYFVCFILLMNFILYINKKFGPGTLVDLLTGKYHHPRNEALIFLFLDLKGSTTLAEKLGHNQYSKLIKECVHELTPVIKKYHARVYQYVGDEVVLYWNKREGFKQANCLYAFFEFITILKQREAFFISTYGEVPVFKAGMDAGIITATEIGDIKREIAFHGDVLNTAARLEKKCNEFNAQLIITQHMIDQLPADSAFNYKFLSDLPLRGKSENVKFYAVEHCT